ncbi:AAA family ATPase [Rhizobium sp. 22-785-1]
MILVTGVSGVGKTYTIERFVAAVPGYVYARASAILQKRGRPVRSLSTEEVIENQKVLRDEIRLLASEHGDALIVDGHAIVEEGNSSTISVTHLFADVPIKQIVIIEDDHAQLAMRRALKGKSTDEAEIRKLQALELAASGEWAEARGARFGRVRSGDLKAFYETLATS